MDRKIHARHSATLLLLFLPQNGHAPRLDEKDKTISQAAATARELKSKVNLRAAELKEREEALHRRLLALSKVERERVEALARSAPAAAPEPPPKEAPAKQAARAFDYLSRLSGAAGKGSTHRPK